MTNNSFTKPPIIAQKSNEDKAEAFLNFEDEKKLKKESVKTLFLRVPKGYWDDIHNIATQTGLTINATCLELLRPAIKNKLKEIA